MSIQSHTIDKFSQNLKRDFQSIFLTFNNHNKLIDAVLESFFILNKQDILLLYKLYELFKDNQFLEADYIHNTNQSTIENKSMNYVIILSFSIVLISYHISFNLKHMLNNNHKVTIFIKKYGETITQLVCFCLPLEINKLIINNKQLRSTISNEKIYTLINQFKNYNHQSFLESMLQNTIITKDIIYRNYINIFNLIIYNQFKILHDINNVNIKKIFLKELSNLIINNYFNNTKSYKNNIKSLLTQCIDEDKNDNNIIYHKYNEIFSDLINSS